MKTKIRIAICGGLAFLGIALIAYVNKQSAIVKPTPSDEGEKEKFKPEEKAKSSPENKQQMILDVHCIRQPISAEIAHRAAALGIPIEPFYGSEKIALIVIQTKISDPEFMRLLTEGSASEAEIAEVKSQWWEKNKERYKNAERLLDSQPEVIEAKRQCDLRLAEIGKMKGIGFEEYVQLRSDAISECTKIRQRILVERNITPNENTGNLRK